MRHKRIKNLIVGGALVGAFLITATVFAYNQDKTHPALTDEIVDFYNLNFPQKLSNQDKNWVVEGSIDEDQGMRPMNHFYDPVYNRGIAGFSTSKQWAMSSGAQSNFAMANKSIAESSGLIKSDDDFSYERAMDDYARGDRQRAMTAFGHLLHLLEDMGVPDHTRNDPHPPVLDWGSPYEHEMAKWNPSNFSIAPELKNKGLKPVILTNLGNYFDKLARHTNDNFFSKDTIFFQDYTSPTVDYWQYRKNVQNEEELLGYRKNLVDSYILVKKIIRTDELTISDKNILDGYWERLSREVVLNGAGALNLFLTEAEKAKTEYANRPPEKPNWFARLLGLIGIGGELSTASNDSVDNSNNGDSMVTPTPKVTNQPVSPTPLVTKTPDTNVTTPSPTLSPSNTPVLTPKVLPQTEKVNINTANKEQLMVLQGIKDAKSDAIIQYRQTHAPFQKIEDVMNVSGIGQTTFNDIKDQITVGDVMPTSMFVASYGGSGGGSSSTPTPTPTPIPSGTPTPTPSPSPTLSPTPTPDSSSPLLQVVINEIAWMGTATSSNDEWMELYNTTNRTIDLSGWTLESLTGASPDPQIVLTGLIEPFGFYLLERTDDTDVSDISADKVYTGALSDTGETLELRDGSNALQDKISGDSGWYAGDKETDSSMERINPKQPGDNPSNWSTNDGTNKNGQDAGGSLINGTPRLRNSVYVSSAPTAVSDLVATLNSPLTISWSAPEDLDTLPASLSYDLRYSLDDFSGNDRVWDTATVVASSSLPSVGEKGAFQNASFDFDIAYQYGQTVYFALKTKLPTCSTENCEESGISNIGKVSFPTAISADSWAMLGKDQYHTSFADNLVGPGIGATISWEFDVGAGNTVGQPVISADGNVYFGVASDGSGKLIKLDKNGVKQWEYATNVSIGTPAVLSDETVYFGRIGAGGVLAFTALNPDGSKKWDYDDAGSVQAVAVSSKGEPHFTYLSGTDKLSVLNADGSVKAKISGSGLRNFTPVVLEDGTIMVTKRISGNQFFNAYSADGTQLWADELFYTGANGSMQSNLSYDRTTGKTYSAIGHDGGSSFSFKVFSIPSGGSVLNTTVIDPVSNGAGATMVSITPDRLLVGLDYSWSNPASGSKLFSLNKSDLSVDWSFRADGKINQQVAVDKDGNSYFSTQSGHLYSVGMDGLEKWHISSGAGSNISPILLDNGIIWGYGNRLTRVGVK